MLHDAVHIITTYGYGALFVACVVEGPIITVVAGFLASQGLLDAPLVFVIAVLGDLTGDLVLYATGRWPWLARRVRFPMAIDRRRLARLRRQFRDHPGKVLLFGKLTHAASFLLLLAAGAARIPLGTFILYSVLGTLAKCAFFLALGYVAGAAYVSINSYLGAASLATFVLICAAGLALVKQRRTPRNSEG